MLANGHPTATTIRRLSEGEQACQPSEQVIFRFLVKNRILNSRYGAEEGSGELETLRSKNVAPL
jgi:hypothetical protein